ncbi:MAG TPA: calcium/sodium antiporter [Candidatus Marinimicrobia bacterium]|nr:calcium/sodium antiporter [Candidatus Neomarinimicrobiota bacterium]
MGINILQFAAGTVLLYYGADFLILGSKSIASKFKIPPIVVGITLVAFGTSLPELIVSIIAILKGESGMVIGNVVGSNIANIGLVLAVTAILVPIVFSFKKISFDLYFLIFITFLPLLFMYLGDLVLWQGICFLLLLGGYCWYLFNKDHEYEDDHSDGNLSHGLTISLKIILGIIGLGLGAHVFVLGAKGIAIALGVSSLVIGMSIVALGTSLPELAASIAAAKHGETGFIIGNIIGSNIMNIVAVLGFTLLISPISVEFSHIATQGIFMVTLTLGLFFLLKFKGGVTNFSAGVLILIYIIFLYFNFQPGVGIEL